MMKDDKRALLDMIQDVNTVYLIEGDEIILFTVEEVRYDVTPHQLYYTDLYYGEHIEVFNRDVEKILGLNLFGAVDDEFDRYELLTDKEIYHNGEVLKLNKIEIVKTSNLIAFNTKDKLSVHNDVYKAKYGQQLL